MLESESVLGAPRLHLHPFRRATHIDYRRTVLLDHAQLNVPLSVDGTRWQVAFLTRLSWSALGMLTIGMFMGVVKSLPDVC